MILNGNLASHSQLLPELALDLSSEASIRCCLTKTKTKIMELSSATSKKGRVIPKMSYLPWLFEREYEPLSCERDSLIKPDFIWIPIGLDRQVWIPIGLERRVWFGKNLAVPLT